MQANGFASRIKVGGADFNPDQGANHVLAGLPAIIAGRYRQIRERKEGEIGMDALAGLKAKFEEQAFRPSHEEIDMCRDHALEVEERSPDNPVKLFTKSRRKALQKARLVIAEKVTKERNGQISMDPATMEAQLLAFEKEIIELGWAVQGKESCRILWGMLTPEHRSVLQHTNCFLALKKEKFANKHNMPATSGFSSIVTALHTHFSGNDSVRPVGSNLACDYFQHPKETLRAFLEQIKRCFIQDLNTELCYVMFYLAGLRVQGPVSRLCALTPGGGGGGSIKTTLYDPCFRSIHNVQGFPADLQLLSILFRYIQRAGSALLQAILATRRFTFLCTLQIILYICTVCFSGSAQSSQPS